MAPVQPGRPRPPVIGGPSTLPGGGVGIGGDNNGVIINNNQWNINNNWNINHGNQWGYPGISTLPGRPWGNGNGCDYWHDHINHHHHHWYHGCWSGGWANFWYSPFTIAVGAWGLGNYYGYGTVPAYANPYYTVSAQPVYDYSQPIVVQQVVTGDPAAATVAEHEQQKALAEFDEALAFFKARDYRQALKRCDSALRVLTNDPVLHEVRALALFALGEYRPAAAVLNSLLATSPGMDWTSMSQIYADSGEYTKHLGALEKHVSNRPNDSSARFLLAYHYLVTGETDSAVEQLSQVVASEPADVTAKRLLESLDAAEAPAAPAANPPVNPNAGRSANASGSTEQTAAPELNLTGSWSASPEGTTIRLSIDDAAGFVWSVQPAQGEAVEITGQIMATADTLVLDAGEQGTMVAKVKPLDANSFQFVFVGAPADDKGLTFQRAAR